MPPAALSGWLRFAAHALHPCLTAQHNTYPGVRLPVAGWCTPQAKNRTRRATGSLTCTASHAVIGDHTTVWVVTDEVPVRFTVLLPFSGRHDTFARKYPVPERKA